MTWDEEEEAVRRQQYEVAQAQKEIRRLAKIRQ